MARRLAIPPRVRRWLFWGTIGLVVLWGALAARAVLIARHDAQAGLDVLDRAKVQLNPKDFLRGRGRNLLVEARDDFNRAHDGVTGPIVAPLRLLPWVGRQVRSVDALTSGAGKVVDVGVQALDEAKHVIDGVHNPKGLQRVALVERLGAIAHEASRALDGIKLGPDRSLAGPLQRAHDKFAKQLTDVQHGVRGMADATDGMADFLRGPRRYLVIAGNNAEMRVGAGAFLSLGEMTLHNGRFSLGKMHPAVTVMPPPGSVLPTAGGDRDIATRWGFLNPTNDFRELSVTGRFDAIGPLAARMWEARTHHHVDGVLVLDPIALRALLSATGPVVVDGIKYTPENLLHQVFVEQYRGLDLDPSHAANNARRERLSAIARAAIKNLERGHWDTVELVDALRKAALGRHIMAWSSRHVEQLGWAGAHIDGHLAPDALLISVHNRGGNKLDQWLPIDGVIDAAPAPDGSTQFSLQLDMENQTPLPLSSLPGYVVGPYPGTPDGEAGKYEGFVIAELPRDAVQSYMDVDGKRVATLNSVGSDGPDHRLVACFVELKPGEHRTVVVHFRMPKGDISLVMASTSRVLNPGLGRPAINWRYNTDNFNDDQNHRISW